MSNISGKNLLGVNYGSFDSLSRDENDNYIAKGWSVLPKYKQPAHAVVLAYQAKDNFEYAFALTLPEKKRPDLADVLGKRQYLRSG